MFLLSGTRFLPHFCILKMYVISSSNANSTMQPGLTLVGIFLDIFPSSLTIYSPFIHYILKVETV